MGVLDEAIREHLELKRSRGADVSEVERQEKEAFGPSGHEEKPVAEAPAPELHAALDEPGEFAADAPPEPPTQLHVADPHPDPGAPVHPVPPADEPVAETEPPRPHGDPADRFPHAPPPASAPVADEPPPAGAQPTREFDLDEVRAATGSEPEIVPADEEPEGDDVLEETPEFLQETPEHDRLWFEQRPPRDFDF